MAGESDFMSAFSNIGLPDMSYNPNWYKDLGLSQSALTDPTLSAIDKINWNDTSALTPITSLAPNPFRTSSSGVSSPGMIAASPTDANPFRPGTTVADQATDPSKGLGFNIPTLELGLGGLKTIGGLYAAFQSNALAKKQFEFTKNAYNQNLTNSIQSYNTALSDRARSRAVMEGQSDAERDSWVAQNSLKKTA